MHTPSHSFIHLKPKLKQNVVYNLQEENKVNLNSVRRRVGGRNIYIYIYQTQVLTERLIFTHIEREPIIQDIDGLYYKLEPVKVWTLLKHHVSHFLKILPSPVKVSPQSVFYLEI